MNGSYGNTKNMEESAQAPPQSSHLIPSLKHIPMPPSIASTILPIIPDSHIESIQSLRLKAADQLNLLRENGSASS